MARLHATRDSRKMFEASLFQSMSDNTTPTRGKTSSRQRRATTGSGPAIGLHP